MDAKAKEQFRWKFYSLALQLNAIILLVALAVLAFFLFPLPFRYPAVALMIVIAAVLSYLFRKKYTETRAWLDEQPDKKEDE
jgi:MFS superfamily sulfate permease-like transporter